MEVSRVFANSEKDFWHDCYDKIEAAEKMEAVAQ